MPLTIMNLRRLISWNLVGRKQAHYNFLDLQGLSPQTTNLEGSNEIVSDRFFHCKLDVFCKRSSAELV